MFLYLLNDEEGKAFLELAVQAMRIDGEIKECEIAEYESYLAELNMEGQKVSGIPFEDAASAFIHSSKPVKRCVIIELCGILYADKEMANSEMNWIYALSDILQLPRAESERLIRWSKDFSDFVEIGLMYINAES